MSRRDIERREIAEAIQQAEADAEHDREIIFGHVRTIAAALLDVVVAVERLQVAVTELHQYTVRGGQDAGA